MAQHRPPPPVSFHSPFPLPFPPHNPQEVDIGLAADVGTLQRLPRIVGNESLVRELAYTARRFHAHEAHEMGLLR